MLYSAGFQHMYLLFIGCCSGSHCVAHCVWIFCLRVYCWMRRFQTRHMPKSCVAASPEGQSTLPCLAFTRLQVEKEVLGFRLRLVLLGVL